MEKNNKLLLIINRSYCYFFEDLKKIFQEFDLQIKKDYKRFELYNEIIIYGELTKLEYFKNNLPICVINIQIIPIF